MNKVVPCFPLVHSHCVSFAKNIKEQYVLYCVSFEKYIKEQYGCFQSLAFFLRPLHLKKKAVKKTAKKATAKKPALRRRSSKVWSSTENVSVY